MGTPTLCIVTAFSSLAMNKLIGNFLKLGSHRKSLPLLLPGTLIPAMASLVGHIEVSKSKIYI